MIWSDAGAKLSEYYGAFLTVVYGDVAVRDFNDLTMWVYDHPVETDLIIGLAVVGSIFVYLKRSRLARSRAYRRLWGTLMKRKDREKYHKMKLEDAISDACQEMVHNGDMTPAEELKWYQKLSKSYDLAGLLPHRDQATVKRGINFRLLHGWWAKKPKLPGDPPGGPVDPNYKPVFEVERRGLNTSKYLTEA